MQWDLAGYPWHPVNGEPEAVADLAAHLARVASDIQTQINRVRECQAGDFWESSAGSADSFNEVVEELPDKLDLVAQRYEAVASALDAYQPVMADTKDRAERAIVEAASAKEDIELAEDGVAEMEQFESDAERAAEEANEDCEPGDAPTDPEEWSGPPYGQMLAEAQEAFDRAIREVQGAAEAFANAHDACAEALDEAGNDDLKNESGFFSGIGDAFDSFKDAFMDFLDVYIQILEVVALALAVVALFVPGLNIAMLVVAGVIFAGTALLYLDGRRTGWDVVAAGVGFAAAGLGAASTAAGAAANAGRFSKSAATALTYADRAATVGTGFVDIGSDGPQIDIAGGLLATGAVGLDTLADPNFGFGIDQIPEATDLPGLGGNPNTGYDNILGAGTGIYDSLSGDNESRPATDLSDIRFEGLDVAMSPADMQVPKIEIPEMGPVSMPPPSMPGGSSGGICSTVEVNVNAGG